VGQRGMNMSIEGLEVSDFICLAGMYPSEGIIGCLESPIKEMELPQSFIREVGESAHLSELKKLSGRAARWFLPGDIVVRYPTVGELGSDVFRQKQDIVLVHGRACCSTDWDAVEMVRSNCIEHHTWDFCREAHQFTLCDPFGRAIVITWAGKTRNPAKGGRIPFKYVANRLDRGSTSGNGSEHAMFAAWSGLKFAHRHMMDNGGTWESYERANKLSADIFRIRNKIGYIAGKKLRMKRNPSSSMQTGCKDYWGRVEPGADVPESLLTINKYGRSGRYNRIVRLSESDLDAVLETCAWPEYRYNVHPWVFAVDSGGRNAGHWFTIRAR
jgi:hypothetical protein